MTINTSASGDLLISGIAKPRYQPQVWKLSASGHLKINGLAAAHFNFPAASFDDFALTTAAGTPDPAMTFVFASGYNTTTTSWGRNYIIASAPTDYSVSNGMLWNRAAYAALGLKFTGVTTGKQQMLDAAQFEVLPLYQASPTAYQPARQLQVTLYPDRLNYCTNPSFEVSIANWSAVGTKAASITLSQDATTAYSNAGSKALKVALAAGINPRVPVTPATTNLVANPTGDLGDDYLPYGAETVHSVGPDDTGDGHNQITITSVAAADAQGFKTAMTALMPVTAGSAYTFSASLDEVGAAHPTLEIIWYDDLVSQISASDASVTATNSWARFHVTGTAPAGARYAQVAVYLPAGTAAGVTLKVSNMQLELGSTATTYVVGSRVADYGPNNLPWQGAAHVVSGLIPGKHYVASARVKLDTGCPRVLAVVAAGSPGTTLPDSTIVGVGTDGAVPVDGPWYLVSVPFVATASQHTIVFGADQDQMNGTATDFWVDAVVCENGDKPGLYFDGGMGADYLWEQGGTAGLARSYFYADRSKKNGIVTLLLSEYTIAGTNVAAPQYGLLPTS